MHDLIILSFFFVSFAYDTAKKTNVFLRNFFFKIELKTNKSTHTQLLKKNQIWDIDFIINSLIYQWLFMCLI